MVKREAFVELTRNDPRFCSGERLEFQADFLCVLYFTLSMHAMVLIT